MAVVSTVDRKQEEGRDPPLCREPYESLKRALRADIDETAWSSLYRTTSRPFPAPETGRIAVKVINHYGDEVMKVLDVGKQEDDQGVHRGAAKR